MRLSTMLLVVMAMAVSVSVVEAGTFRGARAGTLPSGFRLHQSVHNPDTGVITASYLSGPLPMGSGEVVFTDPQTTILTMPSGPIAIKRFNAEVVDVNNQSVPLYEVYNHHWIVMKNGGESNFGECPEQLPYVFGVGEESRNTYVDFPYPYRLMARGDEVWTANIHLIRTVDTPWVKQCIECHCGDVNNPFNGGGFRCCADKSFCPTNGTSPVKIYFLKYTIEYEEVKPEMVPIGVYVFDVSGCNVEYDVPPCANPSSGPCISSLTRSYTFQEDTDIIYAVGHIHVGSINITLEVDGWTKPLCVSHAHYGNGTTAGNEKGYVVGMDSCVFDPPVKLPAGTTVRYTGNYHNDPYHDSVMSLFYVAVADYSARKPATAIRMT